MACYSVGLEFEGSARKKTSVYKNMMQHRVILELQYLIR